MRPWLHHFFLNLHWHHFHPPPLSSYPIQRLLFISLQSSQSSQDSQPVNQRVTLLQKMYCSAFTSAWKQRHSKTQPLSSVLWLIVTPTLLLLGFSASASLKSHLSTHQTKCQEDRLLTEINKPCSNTHAHTRKRAHTHTPLTGSSGLLEQ